MTYFRNIKRLVSHLAILALLSMQIIPAQAAMVSSHDLLQQAQHEVSVKQLVTALEREDIQKKLVAMGVDPVAAKARISRMTDSELAQLNQSLEELPAGSGIVGVLLVIFIVFVITDMLGATDIFPFVKNINK